jgi:hypothetical protein
MKKYKIVVYVPEDHADKLREAMGNAGAGEIGNYEHCTFTTKGIGCSKRLPKIALRRFVMMKN